MTTILLRGLAGALIITQGFGPAPPPTVHSPQFAPTRVRPRRRRVNRGLLEQIKNYLEMKLENE